MIGCIIQARLTSTRFPNKILELINGLPVLEHVVNRVHEVPDIEKVVIASPHRIPVCLNEEHFIGDEEDVLDRYYKCAKKYGFDIIVRITSDCPLLVPAEVSRVIRHFMTNNTSYVYNFPGVLDGMDVEVFSFRALEKAWREAESLHDRQHVTAYMKRDTSLNPIHLEGPKLSLDTPQDLERIKEYYESQRKIHTGDRWNREFCHELYSAHTSFRAQSHTHIQ